MPRAASQAATCRASPEDSGLRRWSTVNARTSPPRARAQRWSSNTSAMLSAPPETAVATTGRSSKGPSAAISRANSAARIGAISPAGSAAGVAALLFPEARGDAVRRAREFLGQLGKGDAGIRFLAELAEGHAELQKIVRRFAAVGILLIALGEGDRRVLIAAAHVIGLPEPVLGVAREIVIGMLDEEGVERLLGIIVFGLAQQVEGIFVLPLHGIAGERDNGAGGRRRPRLGGGVRGGTRRGLDVRGLHLALSQRPQGLWLKRGLLQGLVRVDRRIRRLERLDLLPRALVCIPAPWRGRSTTARLAVLQGAQAVIGILGHLVQARGELLDAVAQLLDLAGEIAHLAFELLEADLLIGGDTTGGLDAAARGHLAVIDILLQIGELLLQPVDLLRQGLDIVLGARGLQDGEEDPDRQTDGREGETNGFERA